MISSFKSLIRHAEDLYEILEKFQIDYFFTETGVIKQDLMDNWKGHQAADIVLKNETAFIFGKKIENIEFEMDSTELIQA